MNSKNMEQLIEKYKREMLSYSARSIVPPPIPDGRDDAGVPDSRYEDVQNSDIGRMPESGQPEYIAGSYDADEYSEEEPELPEEEAPIAEEEGEPFVPTLAVANEMPEENTEENIRRFEEMSKRSVIKFSDLREECRKIATGELAGDAGKKQMCTDLYNFLAVNTATGRMSVQTFASDRVFGIANARVMIFIPFESGNVLIFDGLTDVNGTTINVELPAPSKETSLTPNPKGLPYAGYTVLVEHPDYVRAVFFRVPVFEGIESIQPVQMLAKAEGTNEPNPIIVANEEPPPIRGSAEE